MKNQGFLALVLLCLITSGCYKDQDNSEAPVTIIEIPDTKINTTVYGVILDGNDTTIKSYDVSTDANSVAVEQEVFLLELNQANKRNQHISIVKDNREIAFANVSLIENDYNKLKLRRFPEWEESNTLDANSTIIENDQLEVKINNAQAGLTYGIIDQEATLQQIGVWGRGSDTENFYLNPITAFYYDHDQEDKSISTTFLGSIPDGKQVGLFHLDNNFHQWVLLDQYSSSNLNIDSANKGYYMLANYSLSTFIEGKITYEQLPVSFQNLDVETMLDQNISLITSASGKWSTYVPRDAQINLNINDLCEDVISLQTNISTTSGLINTDLLESTNDNFLPLSFRSVDCNGSTLRNPGIQVGFNQKTETYLFGEENVQTVFATCGNIKIAGLDLENNMKGAEIDWSTDVQDELGVLSSCNATEQGYSYIKINNEVEILPTFALSENGGDLILSAPDNTIRIKIKGNDIGSYMENQVNIFIDDEDFGRDGYFIGCENSTIGCGIDDCYISHLDNMSNGQSRITFSGVLWMQTINNPTAGNYPIEGQIIIK